MRQLYKNKKPIASLSLDLDDQWSYMKTRGDPGWKEFPSFLHTFIPYVLDLLDDLKLKITFFVTGQDAALDKNKEVLRFLAERGHEIANHSFFHEPYLPLYSKDKIQKEILEAEKHIFRVTGKKPVGFRGPCFTWSPDLLSVLAENGYLYDASTFPTYIAPIARTFYFRTSNITKEEQKNRNNIYGSFKDGLRPIKPYFWHLNSQKKLLEIPVSTIPFIKTPFHLSYLVYLSRFSQKIMNLYLKLAIISCELTKTSPSFLLHALDLIGGDQAQELAFFPGMNLRSEEKISIFKNVIKKLSEHFSLICMSAHAQLILQNREKVEIKTLKGGNDERNSIFR